MSTSDGEMTAERLELGGLHGHQLMWHSVVGGSFICLLFSIIPFTPPDICGEAWELTLRSIIARSLSLSL